MKETRERHSFERSSHSGPVIGDDKTDRGCVTVMSNARLNEGGIVVDRRGPKLYIPLSLTELSEKEWWDLVEAVAIAWRLYYERWPE